MNEWQSRDEKSVWHPFSPLKGVRPNLPVVKGEGPYLILDDGRRILDAISSWWVNLHGHSHPKIVEAISAQAAQLEHVIFAGFTHEPGITLAEILLEKVPGDYARVFYSDNGSTSVEVAIKLAFQYWFNRKKERTKIIAIDGAYHGDTFGAMAVGERSIFTEPFFPFLFNVEFLPFPTQENETEILEKFDALIASQEVAGFIFEPLVQGASGMRMYSAELLDTLIEKAQAAGVITIADEVMTGFGRTGTYFASEQLTQNPDVICLSKGLTGGALPLGATLCNDRVIAPFLSEDLKEAFLHGHSYTANPMACAAGLASAELLFTSECMNDIQRISQGHKRFVQKHEGNPALRAVRSMGTILALEFKTEDAADYLSEMRNELYPFFLERDILLRPLGNLIYVLPPYVTSDKDLQRVYEAIEEYLSL